MKRSWPLWVLLLLPLAACSSNQASPQDQANTVVMRDNVFDQDVYVVDVGTTVTFVNEGRNVHNAVDLGGAWSTEESFGRLAMNAGDSTEITFTEPGEYLFVCTFHSANGTGMVATLIVQEPGAQTPVDAIAPVATDQSAAASGITRKVPGDYPTIQVTSSSSRQARTEKKSRSPRRIWLSAEKTATRQ